jgi:hypothetical protein
MADRTSQNKFVCREINFEKGDLPMSTVLHFGKNQGKTLVDTVFSDPAWYLWAIDRGVFHDRGGPGLQIEAETIWLKARNIRKPREYPDGWQVAYYYQGWNHKFGDLRVVANGRYEDHADLKDVLDLGHVCEIGCRDGLGNKILIKAIKRVLFGENTKVTSKRLEAFFADPANFDLPSSDNELKPDTTTVTNPTSPSSKTANTAPFH